MYGASKRLEHLAEHIQELDKRIKTYEEQIALLQGETTILTPEMQKDNERILKEKRTQLEKYVLELKQRLAENSSYRELRIEVLESHIAWHQDFILWYENPERAYTKHHPRCSVELKIMSYQREADRLRERLTQYEAEAQSIKRGVIPITNN